MEEFVAAIGAVLATVLVLFIILVLGALGGAVAGWVVGLFFGQSILGVLSAAGVSGITMWEFGATVGFIGGFFRSVQQKGN